LWGPPEEKKTAARRIRGPLRKASIRRCPEQKNLFLRKVPSRKRTSPVLGRVCPRESLRVLWVITSREVFLPVFTIKLLVFAADLKVPLLKPV